MVVSCVPVEATDVQSKSIAETIAAVKAAPRGSLLIIDLDETLFLRNSSQAFLNCIYPRVLGLPFFLAVKALKPWRAMPAPFNESHVFRDWFLMVAATILFPWTPFVWRSRAQKLAHTHCNMLLAQAIDESEASLVIATRGFGLIVNPIIRSLPMACIEAGAYEVVACRFWKGLPDRAKSKLEMVVARFGADAVARSTVVTDSSIDKQILTAAATPCLLQWPDAACNSETSDWFPFSSLLRRKRASPKQKRSDAVVGKKRAV